MKMLNYYARSRETTSGGVNKSRQEWSEQCATVLEYVTLIDATGGYRAEPLTAANTANETAWHFGRSRGTMIPGTGLARQIARADLLYLNEGWTLSNFFAAVYARLAKTPYVVMPHGVYEEQIVSTLKPFPFRHAMERWILKHATYVHVFFAGEEAEVKKVCPAAKIFVAPTGASAPGPRWTGQTADYLTWIGRFDPNHKGLDLLLEALASIPHWQRPRLVMAGPDYHGGKQTTVDLIAKFDLRDCVEVRGALTMPEAQKMVAESRAFIHSPRWESLGLTVVDSLLMGVPTAVSSTAHIGATMRSEGVGTVFDLKISEIAEAITSLATTKDYSRCAADREWALEYFDWTSSIARLQSRLKNL